MKDMYVVNIHDCMIKYLLPFTPYKGYFIICQFIAIIALNTLKLAINWLIITILFYKGLTYNIGNI